MSEGAPGKAALPRAPSQFIVKHGLWLDIEKFRIDGRSALGQAIAKSRAALAEMFPGGPDAAASLLISTIVYKALRIELFQNHDMATGTASATAIQQYVVLSNSLRNDLITLMQMIDRKKPPAAPDLHQYLAGLPRANPGGGEGE